MSHQHDHMDYRPANPSESAEVARRMNPKLQALYLRPEPPALPPGVPEVWKGARYRWLWPYRNKNGEVEGYAVRYDGLNGDKQVVPFFMGDGEAWRAGAAQEPRPLFGLDTLPEDHNTTVYFVEGEPCAAMAHSFGLPAVTSPGGSKAAKKADCSPLSGYARIVILPDNDAPGEAYASDVAEILRALPNPPEVLIARLPGVPEAGDVVDWGQQRLDGWDGFGPVPSDRVADLRAELLTTIAYCYESAPLPTVAVEVEPWQPCDIRKWFKEQPPRRKFLFEGLIAERDVALLFAGGGVGKTWLLLMMALSAASGVALPGFGFCRPTRPFRVFMVSCEDEEDLLWGRARHGSAGLFGHEETVAQNLLVHAGNSEPLLIYGSNGIERTDRYNWLRSEIEAFKPDLVILDPLARLHGLDENNAIEATQLLVHLQALAPEAAIIISHHVRKASTGELTSDAGRGSSALRDGARLVFTMSHFPDKDASKFGIQNPKGYAVLDLTKANHSPAFDRPIYFKRGPGGVLEETNLTANTKTQAPAWAAEWLTARGGEFNLRELKQWRGVDGRDFKEDIKLKFRGMTKDKVADVLDAAIKQGLLITRKEGREVLVSAPSSPFKTIPEFEPEEGPELGYEEAQIDIQEII